MSSYFLVILSNPSLAYTLTLSHTHYASEYSTILELDSLQLPSIMLGSVQVSMNLPKPLQEA